MFSLCSGCLAYAHSSHTCAIGWVPNGGMRHPRSFRVCITWAPSSTQARALSNLDIALVAILELVTRCRCLAPTFYQTEGSRPVFCFSFHSFVCGTSCQYRIGVLAKGISCLLRTGSSDGCFVSPKNSSDKFVDEGDVIEVLWQTSKQASNLTILAKTAEANLIGPYQRFGGDLHCHCDAILYVC